MLTHIEWKERFEKFLAEVPFEKRSGLRVTWRQKHEQAVTMYYGIGVERRSISEVGESISFHDEAVKQILAQARVMCNRHYEAKQKQEAILRKRSVLAQDIRDKVLRC